MTFPFKYYWLVILLLFTTAACGSSSDNGKDNGGVEISDAERSATQEYFEDVFLPGKQKIFRDISLDLSADEVKGIESQYNLVLSDESDDHLQYEKDLVVDTIQGIDYVEVKYIFDQSDRLDIVTVNYYIQDSLMINNLFDHLNGSFNERYGDYYIDSDGYTVWESSYTRDDTLEITYDIGIRKFIKLNDPGITIELMRFGSL